MSLHLEADKEEIAETVLLPGDPLRAKYIAENFLEDTICYNKVRNMYGYTGTYKGKKISVQGTGMGMPSANLYIHELINEYEAKTLIRVGSCGAMQPEIELRDIVIAQTATTDSNIINMDFHNIGFCPSGDFELILNAYHNAIDAGIQANVGNVFTSDSFYLENEKLLEKLRNYGVLATDMETAGLYYYSSKFGIKSMSIMTVSDQLISDEKLSSKERQTSFNEMIEVALKTVTKL